MVYLERVEIKGFKSFGKSTIVEFDKGFNAISGPNGSGKSNIFDAIRFALGENSPKSLRESKMSLLIHNNDQNKAARVSLIFNNADSRLPLKDSQVVITRELKPDGAQNYSINGRKVSRNSVLDLLAGSRIAYDGLNIVAQGTLTKMVEMGSNEKRQVLEGIIGLKSYDEKKTEALERLREADNQLEVSFAKLDEKRWSIERLELERNEFLRYQQVHIETLKYRGALMAHELEDIDDKLKVINEKLTSAKSKLEAKEDEFGGLALFDTTSSISSKFDEMAKGIISQISEKRGEIEVLSLRKKSIINNTNDLTKRLAESENSIQSLSLMEPSMSAEIEKTRATLAELAERKSALEAQENSVRNEIANLSIKRASTIKVIAKYDEKLRRLAGFSKKLWNKRTTIENSIRILNIKLDDMTEKVNDITERTSTTRNLREILDNRMMELRELNGKASTELSDMIEKLDKINTLKENLRTNLEDANKIIIKSIKEVSVADAIDELLKKYGSGRILTDVEQDELMRALMDSYIGRLSDLVKPKPGFEKAVQAAIALYGNPYIVKSIDDLKKLNQVANRVVVGRVRFVVLESIQPIEKVQNAICDVMEYKDNLATLIQNIFGNIVLSQDNNIPEFRRTVITMEGNVYGEGFLEVGNTIQNQIYNEIDAEKVRKVKTAISNLSKIINRKEETLGQLVKQYRQISKEVGTNRFRIELDKRETKILEEYLRKNESMFILLSKRLDKLRNITETHRKRIAKLKGYLEKVNNRELLLRAKYEAIQTKLKESSSINLDKLIDEKNAILADISTELIRINDKMSELQARLNGELEPKFRQIKDAIEKNIKQINDDKAHLASSQDELNEIDKRTEVSMGEVAKLEAKLGEIKGLVEKDEGLAREEEKKRLRLTSEIGAIKNEIMRAEVEKEKAEAKKQDLEAKLNEMQVDPYEFDETTTLMESSMEAELNELSNRLNKIAEKDYKEMYISYRDASIRRGELEKDRDAIVKFINDIDSQKRSVFIKAYETIDKEFRIIFRKLTSGEAWLELESSDDPFSGGLFIMASFGNKPARESASLSGGEKSVIAVAFLMALQSSYPSPFYLFDEIDANMDVVYTNFLGDLLREWGQKSQLVVVTLRDLVASKANNVIGVYQREGDSGIARLNMEEIKNGI